MTSIRTDAQDNATQALRMLEDLSNIDLKA